MKTKKRFLINVWYSDWIEADSQEEAMSLLADRIGDIKQHEWTYEPQEEDEVYE